MTWLKIIQLLLSLANGIANTIRETQLLDAGSAQETARTLASIGQRLKISDQIQKEIEALSDQALNDKLRGDT